VQTLTQRRGVPDALRYPRAGRDVAAPQCTGCKADLKLGTARFLDGPGQTRKGHDGRNTRP
jgi:hypothetical protein